MKQYFYLLLFFSLTSQAQNGKIISTQELDLNSFEKLTERLADENGIRKSKYDYLDEVNMQTFFYESDGLKVKGYLAYPKDTSKKYPVIIYNRGGNREFGQLNEYKMAFILARVASWGYVVAASQYRGNEGGEGMEEFGGADVNDILNLMEMTKNLEYANTDNMGMYGWSRGGMMTYLTLMKTDKIKAAAVGGGLSDLKMMDESRDGEMGEYVFKEIIPGYTSNPDSAIAMRSAIYHTDKMSKTTPILLLHGTADWRVVPEESLNMAAALQKAQVPYRLVMFEGGDHGLNEFDDEVDDMVKAWFERYLIMDQALPDLKPHGR